MRKRRIACLSTLFIISPTTSTTSSSFIAPSSTVDCSYQHTRRSHHQITASLKTSQDDSGIRATSGGRALTALSSLLSSSTSSSASHPSSSSSSGSTSTGVFRDLRDVSSVRTLFTSSERLRAVSQGTSHDGSSNQNNRQLHEHLTRPPLGWGRQSGPFDAIWGFPDYVHAGE